MCLNRLSEAGFDFTRYGSHLKACNLANAKEKEVRFLLKHFIYITINPIYNIAKSIVFSF